MAAVEQLQTEVLCSVCLECFKDPVSIACGHNFCRACIELCWGKAEGNAQGNFSCPQCRETIQGRTFRPNRELGNVAELVKRLKLGAEASLVPTGVCTRHQEPLKLFCQEEETPICVICRESRDHRSHQVLPIEEAAQDYKAQIQSELQELKSGENLMQIQVLQDLITMKEHLEKIEKERDAVVKEFDLLHQFEQEQKNLFLNQLKELQKEVEDEQKSKAENADRLSTLIRDMEKICQQSDNEFLQDIKNTLSRSRDFQRPVNTSSLTQKLATFSQKTAALKVTLMNFKETFTSELKQYDRQQSTAREIIYYGMRRKGPNGDPGSRCSQKQSLFLHKLRFSPGGSRPGQVDVLRAEPSLVKQVNAVLREEPTLIKQMQE